MAEIKLHSLALPPTWSSGDTLDSSLSVSCRSALIWPLPSLALLWLQVPHTQALLLIAHLESWRLLPESLKVTITQGWFTRPWLSPLSFPAPCSRGHVAVVPPDGLLPLGQGTILPELWLKVSGPLGGWALSFCPITWLVSLTLSSRTSPLKKEDSEWLPMGSRMGWFLFASLCFPVYCNDF